MLECAHANWSHMKCSAFRWMDVLKKEHYNHLQLTACNNIHQLHIKHNITSLIILTEHCSADCQSFCIYSSFYTIILLFWVVVLDRWSVQIVFSTLMLRELEQIRGGI